MLPKKGKNLHRRSQKAAFNEKFENAIATALKCERRIKPLKQL